MAGVPFNPMAGGGANPWDWLIQLFSGAAPGTPAPTSPKYQEQIPDPGPLPTPVPGGSEMGMNSNVNPFMQPQSPPGMPTAGEIMPGLSAPMPGQGLPPELAQQDPGYAPGVGMPSTMGDALSGPMDIGQGSPYPPNPEPAAAAGQVDPNLQLKQALAAIRPPEQPQQQRISSPGAPPGARPQPSGVLELLLASMQKKNDNPLLRLSQTLGAGR